MMINETQAEKMTRELGERAEELLPEFIEGYEDHPAVMLSYDKKSQQAHIFTINDEELTRAEIVAVMQALETVLLSSEEKIDVEISQPETAPFINN